MGTNIRPELSERNSYWIERHRFYELKHFCLQYPIWKKAYEALGDYGTKLTASTVISKTNSPKDPVGKCVEARAYYFERMGVVEQTAIATEASLSNYIPYYIPTKLLSKRKLQQTAEWRA